MFIWKLKIFFPFIKFFVKDMFFQQMKFEKLQKFCKNIFIHCWLKINLFWHWLVIFFNIQKFYPNVKLNKESLYISSKKYIKILNKKRRISGYKSKTTKVSLFVTTRPLVLRRNLETETFSPFTNSSFLLSFLLIVFNRAKLSNLFSSLYWFCVAKIHNSDIVNYTDF